jgi:2-hydroxy-6-oxonona-2,4-dienedioate hydrolase
MALGTNGYIRIDDGKVYYEVAGEGAPVVLLHAGFVDSRMWDEQWDEFSQGYSVIRYDMRGFGKSDGLEGPVSHRQELHEILERTNASRPILVGCSMGGETILDFALERPEMVAGLVLVSTAPGGFELQGEPPPNFLEMLAAVEKGDLQLASELQMRIWVDGPFRQPEQVDPTVRQRAAEMNRVTLAKGMFALNFTPPPDPLDPPAVQRLDQIRVPALIVAGELDHPEILRAAETMAVGIPGAQKVVLEGCAHLPNMEKPAEFNQAVLSFLRGID